MENFTIIFDLKFAFNNKSQYNKNMKKIASKSKKGRVCIALSGGVDSSVAAALLKKQGYDCIGIFMKLWHDPLADSCRENLCCSAQAYEDARKVAHKLGFEIYTLDFSKQFKQKIVDYFLAEHKKGNTPNPCVACNKFIKFNLLLKTALALDCDYLATGHYLRLKKNKVKNYRVFRGKDNDKDQSYFLYNLKQEQLNHLLFPLGDFTKDQVRAMAKKMKLPVYQKPESQEICFISEKDRYPFFKKYLKTEIGPVVNSKGQEIGKHKGYALYTPGQRKGLNIGGGPAYYVNKISPKNNKIHVIDNSEDKSLFSKSFKIKNINWILQKPKAGKKIQVKLRHQAKPVKAKVINKEVFLDCPARSVVAGQSAVFYYGNELLGGGIIHSVKKQR